MLRELHISNLAVIADVRIELAPGLNAFTGATGAGKSLVIGAVEILLGLKNPADMLRPDAAEGRISGLFEISSAAAQRIARICDISLDDAAGELLLTRRIASTGRTSAAINGSPITLPMLREASMQLVDIHAQHDHQYLLKPANQLEMLDQFGHLEPAALEYRAAYAAWQSARQRLADLTAGRDLRAQQLDLFRFQADEIDAANLVPGELEELQARFSLLNNLEKLKKESGHVHAALYESEGALLSRLKMMAAIISELTLLDSALAEPAQRLRDSAILLEEVAYDLSRYRDRLELEPGEIGEVEDRLNTLNRLLNKYGPTTEAALERRQTLADSIHALERASDDLGGLAASIVPLSEKALLLGRALSEKRKAAARKLIPLVESQLAQLGMERARFSIAFEPIPSADGIAAAPSGVDQVELIAQTNPGLPPQPLRKIASGGEMSRIMLALKGIIAQADRVSVLVFDEIDANVGGRLGTVIGQKLRALAQGHQVLCITHLPQIAAFADRHLSVRKEVRGQQTATTVRLLEGETRLNELAEMIGGPRITPVALAQAQEMLDTASALPPPAPAKKSSAAKSPPEKPAAKPATKSRRGA